MGIKRTCGPRRRTAPARFARGWWCFRGCCCTSTWGGRSLFWPSMRRWRRTRPSSSSIQTDIAVDDPEAGAVFMMSAWWPRCARCCKMPGDTLRVMVEGVLPGQVSGSSRETEPFLSRRGGDTNAWNGRSRILCGNRLCCGNAVHTFEQYAELAGKVPSDVLTGVRCGRPRRDISRISLSTNTPMPAEEKQRILSALSRLKNGWGSC